jgi:hypothetical protein
MRLQATQPLAARLLAGFAATALASLTEGFLWSGDGGADHHRMPASPATFLDWSPNGSPRRQPDSRNLLRGRERSLGSHPSGVLTSRADNSDDTNLIALAFHRKNLR